MLTVVTYPAQAAHHQIEVSTLVDDDAVGHVHLAGMGAQVCRACPTGRGHAQRQPAIVVGFGIDRDERA